MTRALVGGRFVSWRAGLFGGALALWGAVLFLPAIGSAASGGTPDGWTLDADSTVEATPNVVYRQASGVDLKVDIYVPAASPGKNPVILTMHGGGWVEGTKENYTLSILPYLERGFAVVNVAYRLGRVATAPAAVEDCRCALRWVAANADTYRIDTSRIILMGWSAGGHLALTTGILPLSAGFDSTCPTPMPQRWSSNQQPDVKAAAIINWFGITDVADLLDGPNAKHYAGEWIGSGSDRLDLARRVSPLQYVRPGIPPVLTIHGDADPFVPYSHAVRLHEALEKAGVPNRLVTIKGGGHGDFTRAQRRDIYAAIFNFLGDRGLLPAVQ